MAVIFHNHDTETLGKDAEEFYPQRSASTRGAKILEGTWLRHRKIINPDFNVEKLKHLAVFYKEGRRIFQLHEMPADLAFQCMGSSYIPRSRHFKASANKKMRKLNNEMIEQLTKITKKREKMLKMGEKVNSDDLLSILLDATKNDIQEGSGLWKK
ncbi:hypothetical protein AgCh_001513 [Apium graveolens]